MKNSHDTIEPATVRVVVHCLSQCATAFPPVNYNDLEILLQEDPGLLNEETFHCPLLCHSLHVHLLPEVGEIISKCKCGVEENHVGV
jgi:hypothetical protein